MAETMPSPRAPKSPRAQATTSGNTAAEAGNAAETRQPSKSAESNHSGSRQPSKGATNPKRQKAAKLAEERREAKEAAAGAKSPRGPAQEEMADPSAGPQTSYSNVAGTRLAELLASGVLQVVKGTYFVDQFERGDKIQMRQEIAQEYIWDKAEVVERWGTYGPRFLAAVSYTWLAKDHPDPDKFHLERLSRIVRAHRRGVGRKLQGDVGVILDYTSVFQPQMVEGVDMRTEEQVDQFEAGVEEMITVYGHEKIAVWRLEEWPDGMAPTNTDDGWKFFERAVLDLKGASDEAPNNIVFVGPDDALRLTEAQLAGHLADCTCRLTRLRGPPLTPGRFEEELRRRAEQARERGAELFGNGDEDVLLALRRYGECYARACKAARRRYDAVRHWSRDDTEALLQALPDFAAGLQAIAVTGLKPGAGGDLLARALVDMMQSGAMKRLQEIDLSADGIGPKDQAALLRAWRERTACWCPADCCCLGGCLGPSCLGQGCACFGLDEELEVLWLGLKFQWSSRWQWSSRLR